MRAPGGEAAPVAAAVQAASAGVGEEETQEVMAADLGRGRRCVWLRRPLGWGPPSKWPRAPPPTPGPFAVFGTQPSPSPLRTVTRPPCILVRERDEVGRQGAGAWLNGNLLARSPLVPSGWRELARAGVWTRRPETTPGRVWSARLFPRASGPLSASSWLPTTTAFRVDNYFPVLHSAGHSGTPLSTCSARRLSSSGCQVRGMTFRSYPADSSRLCRFTPTTFLFSERLKEGERIWWGVLLCFVFEYWAYAFLLQ